MSGIRSTSRTMRPTRRSMRRWYFDHQQLIGTLVAGNRALDQPQIAVGGLLGCGRRCGHVWVVLRRCAGLACCRLSAPDRQPGSGPANIPHAAAPAIERASLRRSSHSQLPTLVVLHRTACPIADPDGLADCLAQLWFLPEPDGVKHPLAAIPCQGPTGMRHHQRQATAQQTSQRPRPDAALIARSACAVPSTSQPNKLVRLQPAALPATASQPPLNGHGDSARRAHAMGPALSNRVPSDPSTAHGQALVRAQSDALDTSVPLVPAKAKVVLHRDIQLHVARGVGAVIQVAPGSC